MEAAIEQILGPGEVHTSGNIELGDSYFRIIGARTGPSGDRWKFTLLMYRATRPLSYWKAKEILLYDCSVQWGGANPAFIKALNQTSLVFYTPHNTAYNVTFKMRLTGEDDRQYDFMLDTTNWPANP